MGGNQTEQAVSERLRLFKVLRRYGTPVIYEMVWANNEAEVYEYLSWEPTDKPPLEIQEIPPKPGCFLSVTVMQRM